MRSLLVVLLVMVLGIGALVYLVRPEGPAELAQPAASASAVPALDLDQPLAWSEPRGTYFMNTTTGYPGFGRVPEGLPEAELTLGQARARLAALPLQELGLDRVASVSGMLEHADLSSLKRELEALELSPRDLHDLFVQESDEQLRTVYLLALGFTKVGHKPALDMLAWWQGIAGDQSSAAEVPSGAARFAAVRANPELCASTRDVILDGIDLSDFPAHGTSGAVASALDLAFGATQDARNFDVARSLQGAALDSRSGWVPGIAHVLGRSRASDLHGSLIRGWETGGVLAAEPRLRAAWSFVEGPVLLDDLLGVALAEDLLLGEAQAGLHARLYVAGTYWTNSVQAVAALEAIEDVGELNVQLNASAFTRPQLTRSTVALLREQRGSEQLRRVLAGELQRVADQLDRAVLPEDQERTARAALTACNFLPDEDGRFGPGVDAWVTAQLPPE